MSLYEGFGLPPLEAMQCGAAVIASNTSSLPEVVGNAGMLLSPTDSDALGQAMLDVYRDAGLRERMRERSVERARQFTWDRHIASTVSAYRTALAR
jgi:glycosyltransferase involved in cell wall biosynthesis